MSVAHLDIAYPSLAAFQQDCVECHCNAEYLLNSGVYSLMVYGFVVSKHHDYFRAEDMLPMDIRPSAWQSRLNIWNNNITHPNHFSLDSEYAWELVDFLSARTPAHGQYRYGHEMAASDWLGCYLMGEEL